MDKNGRLVLCHEVLNLRFRMLWAQDEGRWGDALKYIELEQQHIPTCPICKGTQMAESLFGKEVVVT